MKKGDYVYYRNKDGGHEPSVAEKVGRVRARISFTYLNDYDDKGNPVYVTEKKWVNISNLELQYEYA